MNNFKIGLGSKVRNKVHGFEGIVISRSEHLHACVIYEVQSNHLKDGRPIDAEHFDEDSLEVISAETNKEPQFDFELGSKVRDRVTGFEGVVTIRAEVLTTLPRYAVKSSKLHEGKPIAAVWADEGALDEVAAAVPHEMRKTGASGDRVTRSKDVPERRA